MTFKVGETVVYPHHGAALIEDIEIRVIKGEPKEYLVLKVAQGDLTVRVPSEKAEYVGVRDVVDSTGLERVFDVLRHEWVDAWVGGVVDPLAVTLTVLETAVSTAALALTADVLIRRKEPPMGMTP